MLDCQRKPLFADPAKDVADQIIVGESHLPDSGSRTAIRPNLVKSNRTLTPGVGCVVTNVLIPQIRSTASWDGSAATKYRPIVSFTRRIADHVDGWVTNKSGSAYGCGTRASANPSASR